MEFKHYFRNFIKSNQMVTEVVSTVLLLSIAVIVFSSLYLLVLSHPIETPPPEVQLVGKVVEGYIIIEHNGGEPLSLSTKIFINNSKENFTASRYLEAEAKQDGVWNIGEQVKIKYNWSFEKSDIQVDLLAIDEESQSLIFIGTLTPICDIGIEPYNISFPRNVSTFDVIVTHHWGNIDATDVKFHIILNSNASGFEVKTNREGETYDSGNWTIGNLAIGESTRLTVPVEFIVEGDKTKIELISTTPKDINQVNNQAEIIKRTNGDISISIILI